MNDLPRARKVLWRRLTSVLGLNNGRHQSGRGRVEPWAIRSTSGQIAQLVEQGIENPRVGSSILSLATTVPRGLRTFWNGALVFMVTACTDPCGCAPRRVLSDRCERVCCSLAQRIEACQSQAPGLSWADLGAADRGDFSDQCFRDWDRIRDNLTAPEVQSALEVCKASAAERLSCEQILALYGQGIE